jgi:DNA repair exonuclease SbcCD ATPase subunit
MYITKLKLTNFGKHENLEVNFVNGSNVIIGKSAVGKSWIIRAIRWILFDEIKSTKIRKWDTDKTTVEIELDSGIIIKRFKSDKENAYELQSGKETKRYDSIGKNIPEDVKKVIGIDSMVVDKEEIILNISKQVTMPFLLCDTPVHRMKIFNRLTGNDVLSAVNQGINRDSLNLNKEINKYETECESCTKELQRIGELFSERNRRLLQSKEIFKRISEKSEILFKAKQCIENFKTVNEGIVNCRYDISKIKIPNNIILIHNKLDKWEQVVVLDKTLTDIQERIDNNKKALSKIIIPDIKISRQQIEKYEMVKKLFVDLNKLDVSISTCKTNINSIQHEINMLDKEYIELLKDIKICPIFKKPITDECRKGVV